MKLSKLLTASSVAAILAGAAHATLGVTHVAGGSVAPSYKIANEVDFTALAAANSDDGTYQIEVGTNGTIPPGQNLFLTIQVNNGKFTTSLTGAEFVGVGSGVTGAVVNSGGAADGSTVRYLITSDTVATAGAGGKSDRVVLTLPVDIVGCGDLSFTVTEFQTESGGTPIESGQASQAAPSVTCVSAFGANILPDLAASTIASATGLTTFLDTASDDLTLAVLGDADFDVDSTVNIRMSPPLAADFSHVTGFTASINFVNGANIASADATSILPDTLFTAAAARVGNSVALVGTTPPASNSESGTISIDANTVIPLGPIAAQDVTVSGANLTLNTALNLKATDAFTLADVQGLIYDGQTFGPFDWVADTNGATNNIFRMTNLGSVDVPAQLILTNSNTAGKDGTYAFTILASEISNGEYRLNRQKIQDIVQSAFGTADVTIVLSTPRTVDIDRLIATTATGAVVSNFGDGSNSDGATDARDAVAQP